MRYVKVGIALAILAIPLVAAAAIHSSRSSARIGVAAAIQRASQRHEGKEEGARGGENEAIESVNAVGERAMKQTAPFHEVANGAWADAAKKAKQKPKVAG